MNPHDDEGYSAFEWKKSKRSHNHSKNSLTKQYQSIKSNIYWKLTPKNIKKNTKILNNKI